MVEVRRHRLLVVPLVREPDAELPPGVKVRPLREDETGDLPEGLPARTLEWRLGRGDLVLLAELEGRVVGCCWLCDDPSGDNPYSIPVSRRAGELYGNGLLVLPEARRRGAGTALLLARNAHARAAGATAVLSHVQPGNLPMLRVHEKLGSTIREEVFSVILAQRVRLAVRRPQEPRPRGSAAGSPPV